MITGRRAILVNGTAVIAAGASTVLGTTGITDNSFIPVIAITANGNENVYVGELSFSGAWKFEINRSTGLGQPALNVFWKVIALKPYKEA